MKKLILIFATILTNLLAMGQNDHADYNVPIYANGGLRVGKNGVLFDSVKVSNDSVIGYFKIDTIQYTLFVGLAQKQSSCSYCDEYQAVYDLMSVKPSDTDADNQNTLVKTLVDLGLWSKLDAFYLFATPDTSSALFNWVYPDSTKAEMKSAGLSGNLPTFTAYEGFKGNINDSAYIDLNFNPSNYNINFTRDTGSFLILSRDMGTLSSGRDLFGDSYWQNSTRLISKGKVMINSDNTGTGTKLSLPNESHYIAAIRHNSDSITQYIDKNSGTGKAVITNNLANADYYALCSNYESKIDYVSDAQISAIIIGRFNETQKNLIIDALENYMDNYSKGILAVNGPSFDGNWYGVKGLDGYTADLTRFGSSMNLHATLPVQNEMKACLLKDDGTVNYYLDPSDWSKKKNGEPSKLDGTDGQVMIEIPTYWWLDFSDGEQRCLAISADSIYGWNKFSKSYVGAYEAALYRPDSILSSVKNTSTDYRGGNDNSSWDSQANTLLGKCATGIPIQALGINEGKDFRTFAQNRGTNWHPFVWKVRNAIIRLMLVEYATMNLQKPVNNNLTSEGYRQGGLGKGATTVDQLTLESFNNRYPFIPIGESDSLASGSGEVTYEIPFTTPENVNICRYRGIENIFGHMMELAEGIIIMPDTLNELYKVWVIDTALYYSSDDTTHARYIGEMPYYSGTIKATYSDNFIPKEIDTTLVGDDRWNYYYSDKAHLHNENALTISKFNQVRMSGYPNEQENFNGDNGGAAGVFWIKCENNITLAYNYISTRLVYIPDE